MSAIVHWIHSSLHKIEHELFKDVEKVEAADKEPLGDGQVIFISDIGRITLTLTYKNGTKKQVKAVLKLEAQLATGREIADAWGAFETEIKMYTEVLRSMEKLMDEMGDRGYIWAEYYHCADKKLLIQDLCEVDYKIVPTHKFLNVEHASQVMKALGKFHAMSAVLKKRNLLDSDYFKPPYYAQKMQAMQDSFMHSLNSVIDVIKAEWGPEWSSVPDRLTKYFENSNELLYNAWNDSRGEFDVLNHGDFSMRNMMFHYMPGSDHPDSVKFIDFQVCHYSNPANDLINLLYSSIMPTVRDANINLFLELYIESFTSTAKKLRYEGQVPTFQYIKDRVNSLKPIIFIHILFSLPLFIMSGKEDIQKKADEFFDRFDSLDAFKKAAEEKQEIGSMLSYEDKDVQEVFKYELKKFMDENVF